jgi:hypothetical protein
LKPLRNYNNSFHSTRTSGTEMRFQRFCGNAWSNIPREQGADTGWLECIRCGRPFRAHGGTWRLHYAEQYKLRSWIDLKHSGVLWTTCLHTAVSDDWTPFEALMTVTLHGVHCNAVYKTLSLCKVVLKKLLGYQPLKKFFTFYGTQSFITVFTNVHLWSLLWVSRNSPKPHIIFLQRPFQ